MSKRDYYEVLGVTRTCTEVDLKAAFRKLAMQHHPDRNPGDKDCEHRFKEINEAYDVLKDGDKRVAAALAASVAPTSATIWKSASTRHLPARLRKFAFQPRSPAKPARAVARRRAPNQNSAPPA